MFHLNFKMDYSVVLCSTESVHCAGHWPEWTLRESTFQLNLIDLPMDSSNGPSYEQNYSKWKTSSAYRAHKNNTRTTAN